MTTVMPATAASSPADEDSPYDLFVLAIKAKATRKKYVANLKTFMDGRSMFSEVADFEERCRQVVSKARADPSWLDRAFRDYCIESRDRLERKQLRPGSIWNIISAIRLFFAVNDFDVLKWKKCTRGIPFGRKAADDVVPSREQIVKMAGYPDRRVKVLAYCMASGGWRVGAWEYLKWGHFTPICRDLDRDGEEELVACRVLIYAGEDEQYYTLITPEAYVVTKDWIDLRERSGETINRDSWVMRDLWNDRVRKGGNHQGAKIEAPKRLSLQGIETQLNRAWLTQGVRARLEGERRRHAFSQAHVFRKYFKTTAEGAGMKSINVETLMGHSIGVSDSYYRPREDDLLQDYLQAIPALTFESHREY